MLSWFTQNLGTIFISLALAAVVAAIIAGLVRNKRQGKSTCGSGCANCPMHGKCH